MKKPNRFVDPTTSSKSLSCFFNSRVGQTNIKPFCGRIELSSISAAGVYCSSTKKLDDIRNVVEEEDWLQKVDDSQSNISSSLFVSGTEAQFNSFFNAEIFKSICKLRDRKLALWSQDWQY